MTLNHNILMKQFAWKAAFAAWALTTITSSKAMAQRQGANIDPQETYVLEVGNEMVTLSDFKHVYGKNNRDSVYTIEALDEYMKLFVNFKLKVLENSKLNSRLYFYRCTGTQITPLYLVGFYTDTL